MNKLSRRKLLLLSGAAWLAGSTAASAEYAPDRIMKKACEQMGGQPTRRFFRFYCDGVDQRRWRRRFPPNQREMFLDRRSPRDPGGNEGGGGQRSDRRLKRDISAIGQLPNGLVLYRFRYRWSDIEFVGVMAQEALAVVPDAVFVAPDGYYRVDYNRIGLPMMTYSKWLASGSPFADGLQRIAA